MRLPAAPSAPRTFLRSDGVAFLRAHLQISEALERIKSRLKEGETHVSKSGREIRKLGARSQAELSKLGNDAKVDAANQFAEDMRPFIEPLVARGMNMSAIASHLNRLGIKTSKGGRFYQSTVSGILRRLRNADKN